MYFCVRACNSFMSPCLNHERLDFFVFYYCMVVCNQRSLHTVDDQLSDRLEECDITNANGPYISQYPPTSRLLNSVPGSIVHSPQATIVHSISQPQMAVSQTALMPPHGSAQHPPPLHHHQPPPLQVNSDSEGSYKGPPNGIKVYHPQEIDMYATSIPG